MATLQDFQKLQQDFAALQTQLAALQATQAPAPTGPISLSQDQFQRLLTTVNPTPAQHVAQFNTLTNANYEEHAVPAGHKDAKGLKVAPFSGYRDDARPFMQRLHNHFALCPEQFRLTRTRILFTAGLIVTQPASSWASAISKDVATHTNTGAYTDSWSDFTKSFMNNYGIPNEAEDAKHKLRAANQGSMNFVNYVNEFQRLQHLCSMPDAEALDFFKMGMKESLRMDVYNLPIPPTTLAEWITQGVRITLLRQEQQNFEKSMKGRGTQRFGSSHSFTPYRSQHSTPQLSQGTPMDIDALREEEREKELEEELNALRARKNFKGKGKVQKPRPGQNLGGKSQGPSKPPQKKSPAMQQHPFSPTRPSNDDFWATRRCLKCQKLGHGYKMCPTKLQQLSEETLERIFEGSINNLQEFTLEEGDDEEQENHDDEEQGQEDPHEEEDF